MKIIFSSVKINKFYDNHLKKKETPKLNKTTKPQQQNNDHFLTATILKLFETKRTVFEKLFFEKKHFLIGSKVLGKQHKSGILAPYFW